MNITAQTKLCMVIGDPIEHSLSPQIHNAGYRASNLNFIFEKRQVKKEELADFVAEIRKNTIRGISITLPHKIAIMQYLDELDDSARKIGAVNTIVNDDGKLTGYNTDWLGITGPLGQRITLSGKTVAIIGASGAARAAAYGVTSQGATIEIYNRTVKKAETLANEFGGKEFPLEAIEHVKHADIIINTTPIGMAPYTFETPLPKKYITKQHIVFDVIYTPRETRLLKEAKEKGAAIIHGTEMFLEQAIAQFELYTGHNAPIEAMRK